ncbi:hypothetical protein VPH35_016504 [Triticum aestivum]
MKPTTRCIQPHPRRIHFISANLSRKLFGKECSNHSHLTSDIPYITFDFLYITFDVLYIIFDIFYIIFHHAYFKLKIFLVRFPNKSYSLRNIYSAPILFIIVTSKFCPFIKCTFKGFSIIVNGKATIMIDFPFF